MFRILSGVFILTSLFSCHRETDSESEKEYAPPIYLEYKNLNDSKIDFEFSKPISLKSAIENSSNFKIKNIFINGKSLVVETEKKLEVKKYNLKVDVFDEVENHSVIEIPFYGKNFKIPKVIINQVSPAYYKKKSKFIRSEFAKLYIASDGNMEGVTFAYNSTKKDEISFTFKDFNVKSGDYISLCFRREGCLQNKNTIVVSEHGISKTKGALILYENPASFKILDAMMYINNVKNTFEGFGSKTMLEIAQDINSKGAWQFEGKINANALVSSSKITYTHSLKRINFADTNSKSDWLISSYK